MPNKQIIATDSIDESKAFKIHGQTSICEIEKKIYGKMEKGRERRTYRTSFFHRNGNDFQNVTFFVKHRRFVLHFCSKWRVSIVESRLFQRLNHHIYFKLEEKIFSFEWHVFCISIFIDFSRRTKFVFPIEPVSSGQNHE